MFGVKRMLSGESHRWRDTKARVTRRCCVVLSFLALSGWWGGSAVAQPQPEPELHARIVGVDGCCITFELSQKHGGPGSIMQVVATAGPGTTITSASNPWSPPPAVTATTATFTIPPPGGLFDGPRNVTICLAAQPGAVASLSFTAYDAAGNTPQCPPNCLMEQKIQLFISPDCIADCNGNGVPDSQDILDGTAPDANNNGIPDDCENCFGECVNGSWCGGPVQPFDCCKNPEQCICYPPDHPLSELHCPSACPGEGPCGQPHSSPGCANEDCCEKVCGVRPECCTNGWDPGCVALAQNLCAPPIECPGNGPCDQPHPSSPGCDNADCCKTVCSFDPTCCTMGWHGGCVALAQDQCPQVTECPGEGPCNRPHPDGGCSDEECCERVCDLMPQCCTQGWSTQCVALALDVCIQDCNGNGVDDAVDIATFVSVDQDGNGVPDECEKGCFGECVDGQWCGGPTPDFNCCANPGVCECYPVAHPLSQQFCGDHCPGEGPCGQPHPTPGCANEDCCEKVCGVRPECCENAWDAGCVAIALDICIKDCNGNGVPDANDIANGTSQDTNGNGIPDECECCCKTDLNGDGVVDQKDIDIMQQCIASPTGCDIDVNCDGKSDFNDLAAIDCMFAGGSAEQCCGCGPDPVCPGNGPCDQPHPSPGCSDEECCDVVCALQPACCTQAWNPTCVALAEEHCGGGFTDCNGNGVPDDVDIANGTSVDANGDGVPDECDCCCNGDVNGDGVVDNLDFDIIMACLQPGVQCDYDVNCDGVLNDQDLFALDCLWGGGTPEQCCGCDPIVDCNENGVPDATDIANGTSQDADGNGVPDECDCCCDGDVNNDGVVNNDDFVIIQQCLNAGVQCDYDVNCDGVLNSQDLFALDCLWGGGSPQQCCGCEPEPVCPGSGPCDQPHLSPGCDNEDCCKIVCSLQPSCCTGSWGPICVALAEERCVPIFADCNGNGVPDNVDISSGTSADIDGNGVPDECEPGCFGECVGGSWCGGPTPEFNCCDNPGVCVCYLPDHPLSLLYCGEPNCPGQGPCGQPHPSPGCDDEKCCEIVCDLLPACCTGPWTPTCVALAQDNCDGGFQDCNGNGIPDSSDIANGTSQDIDGNGVPDECEEGCFGECVGDSWCGGPTPDFNCCDNPGVCVCYIATHPLSIQYCGQDHCPGEGPCQQPHHTPGCDDEECCDLVCAILPDCCITGWSTTCVAIAQDNCGGGFADCNGNSVPDSADIANGTSQDIDGNGVPDECEKDCFGMCVGDSWCGGPTPDFNCCDNPGVCVCYVPEHPLSQQLCGEPACPGPGLCSEPHSTPGCADEECCTKVCAQDPFCCDFSWDATCVALADQICEPCFGECINGSYCDNPDCCIEPDNCVCYAPDHPISQMYCPQPCQPEVKCPDGVENIVIGGIDDSFGGGTEPAVPVGPFAAFITNGKDFDATPNNKQVGHTLTGLPPNIASATLRVRIKAGSSSLACNDAMALQYNGTTFGWGRHLGTDPGCGAPNGLLPTPWSPGTVHTFCLNLSKLPNADGTFTNLLPSIAASGKLDFYVQDDSIVDFVEIWYTACPPCVKPPGGMVGWWPMDESVPAVANELINNQDGFFKPSTATGPTPAPGMVANSYLFDGVDDWLEVPANPYLTIGFNDFSVDAWIYYDPSAQAVNPEIVTQDGYRFRLVLGGPNAGLLLWMTGGSGQKCVKFNIVPPNQWVHVAATVDNGGQCTLYVNGAVVHTMPTTPNNFSTNGYARIGQSLTGSQFFKGRIDELEIFNRVLSPVEVAALYQAGSGGKCKQNCHVPWDKPICKNAPIQTVTVTTCNLTPFVQSYLLSPISVAANAAPGCNAAGPTAFSIVGPNPISVPPFTCIPVQMNVTPGSSLAGISCYDVHITNTKTCQRTSCMGSFMITNQWCVTIGVECCTDIDLGLPTGIIEVAPNQTIDVPVTFTNTGDADGELQYKVSVVSYDGTGDTGAFSVNGLPPGDRDFDLLSVAPDESSTITVKLTALGDASPGPYTVLIEADLDGDGEYEPLSSFAVQIVPLNLCDLNSTVQAFDGYPVGWSLLTGASYNFGSNLVTLVDSGVTSIAGAAYQNLALATDCFEVEFDFEIDNVVGAIPDGLGDIAPDGLTFVVAGGTVIGNPGNGIGYGGSGSGSFAIEFDSFKNGFDATGNHVGLDVNGSVSSLVASAVTPNFEETGIWHAVINYCGGTVSVTLTPPGGSATPVLNAVVPAGAIPGVKYLGFTSGNGGNSADVTIDNVMITLLDDCNGTGLYDGCDIATGASSDDNFNGVPDECQPDIDIVSSVPANNFIDPRQPSAPDGSNPAGIGTFTLTFNGDASGLTPADFTVSVTSGVAPTITSVVGVGATATVTLSGFIPLGAWTTITHNGDTPTSTRAGALPADVNGDKTSSATDIIHLINSINGVVPLPNVRTDIDRSGVTTPADILREIDLLNGAGVYDPWNLKTLP